MAYSMNETIYHYNSRSPINTSERRLWLLFAITIIDDQETIQDGINSNYLEGNENKDARRDALTHCNNL